MHTPAVAHAAFVSPEQSNVFGTGRGEHVGLAELRPGERDGLRAATGGGAGGFGYRRSGGRMAADGGPAGCGAGAGRVGAGVADGRPACVRAGRPSSWPA